MKRVVLRVVLYVLTLLIFTGGIGIGGFLQEQKAYWVAPRETPLPTLNGLQVPAYDPNKPTVAVVMGNPTTEVFDFVVPYEMFIKTGAYNVFAVAPSKDVTTITGGLDLAPHYSFAELDQLLGKSPDLLVVPFMPIVDEAQYKPVREWLQKHAQTQILSICGGSGNLAEAGLLKGKSATMHWQFFDQWQSRMPATNWIRDRRYVEDGNIVGSAGLTSGIDAVLYVIAKQLGEPMAEKIAKEMNYPTYHFVKQPKVDPYYKDASEFVYLFNQALQWNQTETGVLLYDGMEDGALASIFDTYSASGTTRVYTIGESDQPIVTKHHLTLIPRYTIKNAPDVERMIVPGTEARNLAAPVVQQWSQTNPAVKPEFMHSDTPNRFIFDAPLEDLAKQEDVLTAKFGLKRLEYRPTTLQFEGNPFSFESFGNLLLLLVLSFLVAFSIDRRFLMERSDTLDSKRTI